MPLAALPPGREVTAAGGVIWNAEDMPLEDFDTALARVERLSPLAHPRLLGALQLYQRCARVCLGGCELVDGSAHVCVSVVVCLGECVVCVQCAYMSM